jgi:hypothetical protein
MPPISQAYPARCAGLVVILCIEAAQAWCILIDLDLKYSKKPMFISNKAMQ